MYKLWSKVDFITSLLLCIQTVMAHCFQLVDPIKFWYSVAI